MPMLILDNFEIIRNHIKNIKRVIVGTVGIAIVLLILSIGMSDADIETDVGIGEDISRWSLPKAAKARLGKGGINVLAFSPDGTHLAAGSNIGVWLYDVKTGKAITMFPGICQSVAFSPDGRYLANGGGLRGHALQIWEIATRQEVSRLDGPYDGRKLRFSSDGKTLIGLDRRGSAINKVDVETGKRSGVTAIEGRSREQLRRQRRSGSESYALTHDKIAIGGMSGTITLWDATTGEKRSTLRDIRTQVPAPVPLVGDGKLRLKNQDILLRVDRTRHVFVLAFSPEGTHLASGGKDLMVRLWDTTGTEPPIVLQKHSGWINALAFSPDGGTLASGSADRTVQLWDTATGERLATLMGHQSVVTALVFSPDGQTLASGSTDGTIRFWRTETGEALPLRITGHTEWVKAVSFLEDGAVLASVDFSGVITLWDMRTLERTDIQTPGQGDMLSGVAFSPDGTRLASAAAIGGIHFDPGRGMSFATMRLDGFMKLTEVRTGRRLATFTSTTDGMGTDVELVFSPDGKTVALGGSENIRIWDTTLTDKDLFLDIPLTENFAIDENVNERLPQRDPQAMIPRFPDQVTALIFTPDGRKLVGGTLEGKVQMWDAETGIALAPLIKGEGPVKMEGDQVSVSYPDGISELAYSADSDLLVVSSYQRTRLLGRQKQIGLKEIPRGASALAFSPDQTVLVRAFGFDIELWDLATEVKLTTLKGHTSTVNRLIFSPDGKTLVSAGRDGTILLWDWDVARAGSEVTVD